jgi:hypothetical protein
MFKWIFVTKLTYLAISFAKLVYKVGSYKIYTHIYNLLDKESHIFISLATQ